ncbi:MAG: hypothetical protein ABI249_08845, partial [Ornithinibacter sp.]
MVATPSEQHKVSHRAETSPPADASNPLEPSSYPPVPLISSLLARRLNARVLDPEIAVLAPGQPAPLPTVYISDTLLVRDIAGAPLDTDSGATRVDELVDYARGLPEPVTIEVVGTPVTLPDRSGAADSLGAGAQVTVSRIRLVRDPDRAGKSPDAWRFLQTALTEPSERATLLYDKLGLGRLPERPEDEPGAREKERQSRRDRRGRSMAGGVAVEHLLTAGGGVWGGGGGVWGGGGGVWGGGGGVWGGGGGVWGGGGGV